ncbi:MAG: copper homeostasis membrane protein CopD, partial [Pseudolabrys sp.]
MSDPLVIVRTVHIAACVVALGTVAFAAIADRPARGAPEWMALERGYRGLAAAALAIAVLSGAVWLVLVARNILDVSLGDLFTQGGLGTVAVDTRFGRVACLRLLLALAAAATVPFPRLHWLRLMTAAALTGSLAWTGHAGAGTGVTGDLHLGSDILHLLAAGLWLGALPALVLLLRWGRDDPDRGLIAAAVTRRFSLLALISVAILTGTGIANSLILVGWPADLLATAYGRVLALKVALFGGMLGLAAFNRYRLTPVLPAANALRALTMTVAAETALGAGILLLVGLLGTLPPASHLHIS